MSWVRCWHPSMRRLQWCLWWTVIWVGMRDEATLARPSSSCCAIPLHHDMTVRSYDAFRHHGEKFVRCHCLILVFLRPDDPPDDWNTFFQPFFWTSKMDVWLLQELIPEGYEKCFKNLTYFAPLADDPLDGWSSECCRCYVSYVSYVTVRWKLTASSPFPMLESLDLAATR